MQKELLETYISRRLSIRKIADAERIGPSTVKYWLKKHQLKTDPKHSAVNDGRQFSDENCHICAKPLVTRLQERGSTKCDGCMQKQRRYLLKVAIVEAMGGCCTRCGWNGHISGYDIHHKDPTVKEFSLSSPNNKSVARLKSEMEKCELLCAPCHRKEHSTYDEYFISMIQNKDRYHGKF